MKQNKNLAGACCGIMTGGCWGMSGVCSQYLFTHTTMQSSWFVAVRMLAAGSLMILLSFFSRREEAACLLRNKKDLIRCIATGVLGTMLFQFACYGAVQKSNAATAIVLQYLCPVMVMIYACIKERKKPKAHEMIALLLAVAGIVLIATHGNLRELVITEDALIWGIGCAFFMSLNTVLPEPVYRRYSIQTITSVALFSGGLVATVLVCPIKNPPIMDTVALVVLLAAVLCGSVVAYLVYGLAIKLIGASRASLFACAEIPAATVLSLLFLHTRFTWMDLLGFVLIASTIFLLSDSSGA